MIAELTREWLDYEVTMVRASGRTPLHVDFDAVPKNGSETGRLPEFAPARMLQEQETKDEKLFNAIGARMIGKEAYQPVLDCDNGIVNIPRIGAGFVLKCSGEKTMRMNSVLPDVIRDCRLGTIETFVTNHEPGRYYAMSPSHHVVGLRWRPEQESDFAFVTTDSSRAHLYIQRELSATDHKTLLGGLEGVGAISRSWHDMAKSSGNYGGIVRTPWTVKLPQHEYYTS